MNMNDNKPNFLDKGTILALLLILVFWFGWSKFMESQYPQSPAVSATEETLSKETSDTAITDPATATIEAPPSELSQDAAATVRADEELLLFEADHFSFHISSHGMGLRDIVLRNFKTRDEQPIILGAVKSDLPFSTYLVGKNEPINFHIERTASDTYVGTAFVGGTRIEKTMKIDQSTYSFQVSVKASGNMSAFKGLVTTLSEPVLPIQGGGFFGDMRESQGWFLNFGGEIERQMFDPTKGSVLNKSSVNTAALSSHYFTLAVVDRSELSPKFESTITANAPVAIGRLLYEPLSKPETFETVYVGYAGPKELDVLSSVDVGLPEVIDFGIFGFLGKPILQLLKYLYSIFGNWGWAIVFLTIIVRALVLPFNAYSYKSMKAMQKIQPEMNRIREKYKDKPDMRMQMNQEIMQLMKDSKASPLGGCLPMLLQLPPFFALYQVLGQSIELYRAPFIFWIHDLSAKDPFFVLPILMGVTMFIQQKITPTTMDPQQARIMMWMPVIFSFFMLSLPSGLTLYIFVSTLFGIGQQYLFMRDKSAIEGQVKEAKA